MNFSTFNSNATAARFLRRLGVAVLALVASTAAINWLVDPYGVFVPPRIAGLNAIKPAFVEHLRLTIPYAIERLRPDGLILGTSRAGRGFSTTHPSWHGLKVYNSALPAASIYEMRRLLQHAHAVHPLQRVVLGLDHRVFYQNRDGDEIPVWLVYVGDEEAEPTSTVYKFHNFKAAEQLANKMAADRRLDLIHEASPA